MLTSKKMENTGNQIIYKLVLGEPGYRVGTDGTAWTLWRAKGRGAGGGRGNDHFMGEQWKPIKITWSWGGYGLVVFRGKGPRQHRLGRVILETFVGPCPPGFQCRHLDGNPRNNALTNLAWGTAKDNADDRERHGTTARGAKIANAVLTEAVVLEMHRLSNECGWTQIRIGALFDYDQRNISAILRGAAWKATYRKYWEGRECTSGLLIEQGK